MHCCILHGFVDSGPITMFTRIVNINSRSEGEGRQENESAYILFDPEANCKERR